MVDILLSRLHIYEERTGKYLSHFKHYVDDVRIILDIGCGRGAFSKALARQRHPVIALDIESKLLSRRLIHQKGVRGFPSFSHPP